METQKQAVSPVAIGIRFGMLLSVVLVIVDFLIRIVGLSVLVFSVTAGTLTLVVTVFGVVLAHRAFKQSNNALMSYSQGIIITIIMLLLSGLVSALFNYLYVNYIDPEFVDRMKGEMVVFMERNGVSDSQIAKSTAQFEEMRPPFARVLLNGIRNGLIGGTLLGLIVSAFTKRKPADFE